MKTLIRTRAVLNDLIRKINKIAKRINVVVQGVFLGYFGYEIYKNIGNVPFLICYGILLALTFASFVADLSKRPGKTRGVKKFKKVLKLFKYPTRITMLGFNVYDKVVHGHTELEIAMLIVTGVLIAFNILVDLVGAFVNEYVQMLEYSFNKDIEPLTNVVATISNKYALLDLIPEALARRIEGDILEEEPTAVEMHVEEIAATFIEKEKAKKAKRKEVHKIQKQAAEEYEKRQLKHHLQVVADWLLGRKKKKEDDTTNE